MKNFIVMFAQIFVFNYGPGFWSEFDQIRLTLKLNSALDSTDSGRDIFREHLDHS